MTPPDHVGDDGTPRAGDGRPTLVRSGSVGTGELADGSVAAADLNLASVATALAARSEFITTYAMNSRVRLRHGTVLQLPAVAGRVIFPWSQSNGTDTGANFRLAHTLTMAVAEVRFLYVNAYGAAETLGGTSDSITVRAGCEIPSLSVTLPVFFRGSRSVVIEPGGYVLSDPVPVELAAGAQVVSRTNVAVTSGGKWPVGPAEGGVTNEGAEKGTGITDKTLSGSLASATGINVFGPVAVVGRPASVDPFTPVTVGIIGDSIAWGFGDNLTAAVDMPAGNLRGPVERALGTSFPFVNLSAQTETAATFNVLTGHRIRKAIAAGASSFICEYGINDITGGASFATMQSRLISTWTLLAGLGGKVWQTTITPVTTSTDNWRTTANQTPHATNGIRTQVNDWIRDGAPMLNGAGVATGSSAVGTIRAGATGHPLTGYFETADAAESARNSGLWRVDPSPRTVTDAAITSGQQALTSASASFTSADRTKRIFVAGAGAAGAELNQRIITITSGTQVQIGFGTAGTTVTGASATITQLATIDGTHPESWMCALMAAAINPTVFT